MKLPITVTIITKNSARYITSCLTSVQAFDEIILLDNGSTDNTLEIAQTFSNVKIYLSEFIGFGPLKNRAISYATHEWILSLDSDEVISEELLTSIKHLHLDETKVYAFERLNHYREQPVLCCGWNPDKVTRLFSKRNIRFSDAFVHESLLTHGYNIETLQGKLLHYSFNSIEELLDKMQRYSTLWAEQNRFRRSSSLWKAILRAKFAFWKNYLLQKGFLCGKEGLLISWCNTLGVFFKYAKLAEKNSRLTTSLIITTYNRPDALELVLLSAFAQKELPDEIIIADDGSGEATRTLIENYQKISPVPLLHAWQEDKGFRAASSRNNALRLATHDYIILIDGDMILHPSFINDHKKIAQKGKFVQGSRVLLNQKRTHLLLNTKKISIKFFTTGIFNRLNMLHFPIEFSSRNPSHGIRTCNMAFWLDDAKAINGFDEEFIGWGREDSDFALRLMNYGLKRKNLKFGAIQYHLWHNESSRESLKDNDQRLTKTRITHKIQCLKGLDGNFSTVE